MARYRGPRAKISRRFSEPIFGKSSALAKKNYPPGMHGRRRRRQSEYAIQLGEKQKVKYAYGILERQFSNLFAKAFKKTGITGENLLQLLEQRLDNTVYRLGLSPSRRGARQLVSHGHIMVNERLVNIPSYTLREGDKVDLHERSKGFSSVQASLSESDMNRYPWLSWDAAKMSGCFVRKPTREEIPENIKEQLIVELYSK